MATMPTLAAPGDAIELFLYSAATHITLAAVLLKDEDDRQMSVYYVSKVLQQMELNYTQTEKMVFILIVAGRKRDTISKHARS